MLLSITSDVLSFQSVFQCWLHDSNMDSEHLSLSLPPSGSGEHHTHILPPVNDTTHRSRQQFSRDQSEV